MLRPVPHAEIDQQPRSPRRRSQSRHRSPSRRRSYPRHRSRSTSRHGRRYYDSRYHSRSRGRSQRRSPDDRPRYRSLRRTRSRLGSRSRSRSRYRSPVPRHNTAPRTGPQGHSAPPWPSHSASQSSRAGSAYYTDQGHMVEGQSHWPDEGQDPSQAPTQWPFWTPMAYHQSQGAPSRASQSAHSESRAPEATVSRPPPEAPGPAAQTSAEIPDPEALGMEAPELTHQDLPQDPLVPGLSSSSSADEAVAGASSSGPPPIDLWDHQDLLRRLALNMNLQVEEVVELEDPVVDILTADAPTRVALPFVRTIFTNATSIWQSPASVPPTARGVERKYTAPRKDFELFLLPGSSPGVVDALYG
ncbi:uncharacterized protein RBU57_000420 [Macrochelys suwanniensis]